MTNIDGGWAVSVEIKGAEQLATLSRRLREMADKELQRELSRGISQAVRPLRKALRDSARTRLPRKGRLNERVARARIITKRATSARGAQGVRLQAGGSRSQVDEIDRGRFRHPVFGRREAWVEQSVTSGWWTKPTDAAGDDVRRELLAAVERVSKKLDRPL